MANRNLEWVIKMVDQMSAPAEKAGGALGSVVKQVDEARKMATAADAAFAQLSKGLARSLSKPALNLGQATRSISKGLSEAEKAAKGADSAVEKLAKTVGKAEKSAGGDGATEVNGIFKGVLGGHGGSMAGGLLRSIVGDGAADALGLASGIGAAVGAAMLLFEVFKKIGDMIAAVVEKIGEFAYEISKFAVETAAFKEQTMIGLSTVLGSDVAAQRVFGGAMRLGGALPLDMREGLESTKRFAIAGISDPGTLQRLTVMTSDVKAFSGEEGASGFMRQMVDMATVGMQARHLMFLSQQTGIREDLILKNIRQIGGFTGSDEHIKKLIEQGAVSKNVGFNAVAAAMSEQERGPIGTITEKLADSFDGLITRLKNQFFRMFADFDTAPGFAAIKGALKNVVELFDPSSGTGASIKSALGEAVNGMLTAVFGDLSGDAGKNKIQSFLSGVPGAITKIGQIVSQVIGAVKGFAEGFMEAVGPSIDALLQVLGGGQVETAQRIFELIGFFLGSLANMIIDMITAAAAIERGFEVLLGGNTAVDHPHALTGFGGQFHGAAPSVNLHQTVNVQADPKDAPALSRVVGDASRSGMQNALGRLALSSTGKP